MLNRYPHPYSEDGKKAGICGFFTDLRLIKSETEKQMGLLLDIFVVGYAMMTFVPKIMGSNSGNSPIYLLFILYLFAQIIVNWRIFERINESGFASLAPVYNWIALFSELWGSGFYAFFMLIPGVNVVFSVITVYKLCKYLGYNSLMCIIITVFYPVMQFYVAFTGKRNVASIAEI